MRTGIWLCLLPVTVASAQFWDGKGMLFPSDGQNPPQAHAAELLEAVCPGKVGVGKAITCKTGCPSFTGFGGTGLDLDVSVTAVTRGHFLSPTSEDAVLSMVGCEPHSMNFGGTILLTRRSGKWSMLWYKAGVPTDRCHKVTHGDGREVLVCLGTYGGQGGNWASLYLEDLSAPTQALMAGNSFFDAYDNTIACGYGEDDLIRSHIDRVEFLELKVNGLPVISVTASFGKKLMTPADVDACGDRRASVLPPVKSYRIEFFFDGHGYAYSPSTEAVAQIFKGH